MPNVPMPRRRPQAAQPPMPRRRPRDPSMSMGTPRDVARQTAIDARRMREEAGDEGPEKTKTITIEYNKGGYVCKPNPRKGNIDMRKKRMVRMTKDNRKMKG